MKCPKCGFENRPDARFCKQCGQPLQAQPTPPAPQPPLGTVCPACGATAKPGARFCPRCGKPLTTAPTPPPTPPLRPPAQMPTQPSMPSAPAQPPVYAQPPAQPPPLATPAATERRFPRWIWWVGGIAAFICVVAFVVTAIVFGPGLLRGTEEPTATPVPVEAPTMEALPIETPTTETPPTEPPATEIPTEAVPEAPATEAPTATPLAEPTPTESAPPPPSPPPLAEVSIVPSAPELRVGELLTVTITIANIGKVPFGNLRCQLLGQWETFLKEVSPRVVVLPELVEPETSKATTFVLEAIQVGTATLQVAVTMEAPGQPPRPGGAVSESIPVSVVQ